MSSQHIRKKRQEHKNPQSNAPLKCHDLKFVVFEKKTTTKKIIDELINGRISV